MPRSVQWATCLTAHSFANQPESRFIRQSNLYNLNKVVFCFFSHKNYTRAGFLCKMLDKYNQYIHVWRSCMDALPCEI